MGFNLVLRLKKRKRPYLAHIFFPQFEEVILKTSEASELELAHKYNQAMVEIVKLCEQQNIRRASLLMQVLALYVL